MELKGVAQDLQNQQRTEAFKDILALASRRDDKVYAWLRWLVLLASGAFTVLVSLHQPTPNQDGERLCIKLAWTALGAGILFGAFAIYSEVWVTRKLVKMLVELKTNDPGATNALVARPPWLLRVCEALCYVSLLTAVIALVLYGLLRR
jgi:hypothetical protein